MRRLVTEHAERSRSQIIQKNATSLNRKSRFELVRKLLPAVRRCLRDYGAARSDATRGETRDKPVFATRHQGDLRPALADRAPERYKRGVRLDPIQSSRLQP